MNQEQVWNKLAEPWSKVRSKPSEEVINFLKSKKGRVLDLGCGSGRNLVANPNIEYYGVDFSEEMLKFAEKRAKELGIKAIFFKADAGKEKLPFSPDFFDAALFVSTLHCIETAEARKNALEELYRVMKKGKEAMITVWNKEKNKQLEKIPAKEGFVNWKKDRKDYGRYYYFYEKKELEDLLKEIGFKVLKAERKTKKLLLGKHSTKNIIFYVRK